MCWRWPLWYIVGEWVCPRKRNLNIEKSFFASWEEKFIFIQIEKIIGMAWWIYAETSLVKVQILNSRLNIHYEYLIINIALHCFVLCLFYQLRCRNCTGLFYYNKSHRQDFTLTNSLCGLSLQSQHVKYNDTIVYLLKVGVFSKQIHFSHISSIQSRKKYSRSKLLYPDRFFGSFLPFILAAMTINYAIVMI